MRLLQIVTRAWRAGGDSEYALALTDQLRQLGVEVEVFATADSRNPPLRFARHFPDHYDFTAAIGQSRLTGLRRAAEAALYSRRSRAGLRHVLQDFRPDAVHIHGIHQYFTLSCALELRRFGAPVLYTAHDYKLLCGNTNCFDDRTRQSCTRCLYGKWWQPLFRRCKKNSRVASTATVVQSALWGVFRASEAITRIHAPSSFAASLLRGDARLRDKVFVLPTPVIPLAPEPPDGSSRRPKVVFAGRLEHLKGVVTFARAVKDLSVPVFICGAGSAEQPMRDVLAGRPATHWTGWLPREDLARIMVPGAIVVVPSECFEVLPLVVGQAMQRGCCVVASRIGGVAELIRNPSEGVLVPPGDPEALRTAIERLLAQPDEIWRIGEQASLRMRAWPGLAAHANSMLRMYEGMCS